MNATAPRKKTEKAHPVGLTPSKGTNPEKLPTPRAELLESFQRQGVLHPELCYLTSMAVGHAVSIYWWNERAINPSAKIYYQVMRQHEGPGPGEEFWSHHLWERPQWYDTPEAACAAYVASCREWLEERREAAKEPRS